MSNAPFDVLAIGNAIVDILVHTDEAFLRTQGLVKGTMGLVDLNVSTRLYETIDSGVECSGGSAANTITAITSLGGRGAFVGKVGNDTFGHVFTRDMNLSGVHFKTEAAKSSSGTATCIVFITPDAERTMQTYLGASLELNPEDIVANDVKAAKITFLEGYLWDPPAAKDAFLKAANLAHSAGREVSLSLSDRFCVDRHRQEFLNLVDAHIDILFANEEEIQSLFQLSTFHEALTAVRQKCAVVAITRGALGCVIVQEDNVHEIEAETVENLVDTTGAGDAFAAGFLASYAQGTSVQLAGRVGNIAASEVISHTGARSTVPLKKLVAERLSRN